LTNILKPVIDFTDRPNSRFERKFFISGKTTREIEAYIKCNSAIFSEIYQQRRVNNIYLDSVNKSSFWQNIDGDTAKKKQRIRWYGHARDKIQNPTLEYKIKKGMIGLKLSKEINSFNFSEGSWYDSLSKAISSSQLSNALKNEFKILEPTLLNCYDRKYFLSSDKRFRLTLDSNMTYFKASKFGTKFLWKRSDQKNIVLELKYSVDDDMDARKIYGQFPYRVTKHSKYINGVALMYSIRNMIFNDISI
jgi:hypothetical protein